VADEADEVTRGPTRWWAATGSLVSVAGLAVSAYLTVAHYRSASTLACPDTGLINCAKVTTSSYAVVFGVPLVIGGLAFFAAMIGLQLPAAWRSANRAVRWARLGIAVAGMGMVLWLVYVELFRLDAICLWCSVVHVLTFVLFVVTVGGSAALSAPDHLDDDADEDVDDDVDEEFRKGRTARETALSYDAVPPDAVVMTPDLGARGSAAGSGKGGPRRRQG
jgi:uncharacterized membrane protein